MQDDIVMYRFKNEEKENEYVGYVLGTTKWGNVEEYLKCRYVKTTGDHPMSVTVGYWSRRNCEPLVSPTDREKEALRLLVSRLI